MRRLAALLAGGLLASGCSTALTPTKLGPSFAQVFSGLYASQQSRLGRTTITVAGLQSRAVCQRSGTASDGPGEDWRCTVQYLDDASPYTQVFEVQVKPDGCWKAEGPPTVQPPQLVDAVNGTSSVNPLAEFDGCLDPSW